MSGLWESSELNQMLWSVNSLWKYAKEIIKRYSFPPSHSLDHKCWQFWPIACGLKHPRGKPTWGQGKHRGIGFMRPSSASLEFFIDSTKIFYLLKNYFNVVHSRAVENWSLYLGYFLKGDKNNEAIALSEINMDQYSLTSPSYSYPGGALQSTQSKLVLVSPFKNKKICINGSHYSLDSAEERNEHLTLIENPMWTDIIIHCSCTKNTHNIKNSWLIYVIYHTCMQNSTLVF